MNRSSILFLLIAGTVLFIINGCRNENNESEADIATAPALFTLLNPDQTNIGFQNTLTEGLNTNILMYEYFYNGGGVAASDFNNDGLTDIYFTSNMSDNKLYLNQGNLKFMDITTASQAGGRPGPWKTGVNAVDINADGKMDIYLCYSGTLPPEKRVNQLFVNKGNDANGVPRFVEQAEEYGLASSGYSNQSYFFDFDKDGDLDLLLLNHNPKNLPILNEVSTAKLFRTDNPEKGLRLFRQDNGRFADITQQAGINGSELSYGLGLGISDLDGDGWPDFYVSNDYAVPDYLYINNRIGGFENRLTSGMGHTSQFSMGNDIADVNNDGLTDIYTLDMLPEDNHRQKLLLMPDNYAKFGLNVRSGFYYQYMRNMLQLNNGNGTFSETGQIAGVSNTDWSWAALLADYDNDGWKDLFITNGYFRDYTNLDFINYMNSYVQQKGRLQRQDVMQIIQQMPSSNVANYIFRNSGDGMFSNAGKKWGVTQVSNSNGAAYADLDNDGDLDLIVNNINLPAYIYRNDSEKQQSSKFLQVRLTGEAPNTQGIGARVVLYSNGKQQVLEQYPTRGYLSSVSTTLHFGMGDAEKADSLVVIWNSGRKQKLTGITTGKAIVLTEKDAVEKLLVTPASQKRFAEIRGINYVNEGSDINDFNRQPLLICELSYQSPSMAKGDINGDGLEDLIAGGAAGQAAGLFVQQKNGTFLRKNCPAFEADKACEDAGVTIFDANGDGYSDIYMASGGYHDFKPDDPRLHDRLYLNDGKGNFTRSSGLPVMTGSKSAVVVIDVNMDDAPDLFVGGRVVPGRYPESPRSYILINDGRGNFSDQTERICSELVRPGMVTSALRTDLNSDGQQELIIAGEWMPILVFQRKDGKLVNVTSAFFEKPLSGWWNTLAAADLNGDGKPDLIAGNMGLNTQFKAGVETPLEMYYKDFDNNGTLDPVFSFYIQGKRYPFVTLDELAYQMPSFRKKYSTFKSYADVTLDDLLPASLTNDAGHLKADHMATSVFLSAADGKFRQPVLPREVQYSPVNTAEVLDVNNDGHPDLVLAGNNNRMKIRLGKSDANYGILLMGDGKGNFLYVPQKESGFNIRGEVKSSTRINDKIYFGISEKGIVTYSLINASK